MANMAADNRIFSALTVTVDGDSVQASNGVLTTPDHSIDSLPQVQTVFVCGPNPNQYPVVKRLIKWLRSLRDKGVEIGGIDSGSELLARAGLLNGYRCTIHWQDMAVMRARYPRIVVSNHMYEIDRDRLTSGGGAAAMDMILEVIRRHENGDVLAAAASDLIVHERMRGTNDRRRVPLRQRLGTTRPGLSTAVAIMEANLEDPIRLPELARYVDMGERQLERLFREHLDCTPSQYYMELRLNMARQQILNTEAPITEIARANGFGSPAHFSRRYSQFFGVTASEERRRSVANRE
jgi:transcriptional regulator GlxA family with amidase domain